MTGKPACVARTLGRLLLLALLAGMATAIGPVPSARAEDANHLILSEVVVKTRDPLNLFGSPYIMVVNPTDEDLPLDDVYLTDGTTSPSAYYYFLPLASPAEHNPGGGNGGDFHARFPAGYILAAGDSLAISLDGSTKYQTAYGRLPDFELFEDGTTPDAVPELVEAFPGAINAGPLSGSNVPALSDIGESLVLYSWDGITDLVQDLDYLAWGNYAGSLVDKSGITVGEDTYADDTDPGDQDVTDVPGFAEALRRVSADEGTETGTGGNGFGGDDETSENLGTTWSVVDVRATGHGVPAPPAEWHPAAPIVSEVGQSPAAPYEGQDIVLEITALSFSQMSSVTFFYSLDGAAYTEAAGILDGGLWTTTIPSQGVDTVVTWYAVLENVDGGTLTQPVGAPVFFHTFTVDEAPDPSAGPFKLLLTEICTKGSPEEFIEIYNPGDLAVDMSDYYLGDAVYQPNEQGYWNIGGGATQSSVGGGAFTDFQARFPDGFTIAAGDTITVSIAGSGEFAAAYGFLPDLELFEDDALPDNVPDMRPLFETAEGNSILTPSGSNSSIPTLTNSGESVALYFWQEGDALAVDIDLFLWGGGGSYEIDKTGVSVAGSTYQPDNPSSPFAQEPDFGFTYSRVDLTEGNQITSGGNGVLGRDETSEDFANTFQMLPASPSRPSAAVGGAGGSIELLVEAKTFIPAMGELMPIRFVSRAQSETRLRLFDLEGRVVQTLWDSRRNGPPSVISGAYTTVVWDGRDDNYNRVKAGMYVLHLQAVDNRTGEKYESTAPVVVATRLSR